MTIRLSLLSLATLLFVTVLASLSAPAYAYGVDPEIDGGYEASRMLATGPLNVVTFRVSGR